MYMLQNSMVAASATAALTMLWNPARSGSLFWAVLGAAMITGTPLAGGIWALRWAHGPACQAHLASTHSCLCKLACRLAMRGETRGRATGELN